MSSAGESAVVLSVVVPVKDEEESLSPLHREITAALAELGVPSEIVYVDDGSTDGSAGVLRSLAQQDPRVRVGSLDRNYGQSTAMIAGAEMARGEWVATLDADGQNDPADLPRLWQARLATCADAVQGVRRQRHDSWIRKVSSRIANHDP